MAGNRLLNIVDLIQKSQCILIVGHVRPDGDCLGSGLAIYSVAKRLGKRVCFVCDSEIPKTYSFMPFFSSINEFSDISYDLVIAVDCGDISRMGRFRDYLCRCNNSVNIDHHITNNGFAKINCIKPEKSSTCEIVFELLFEHDIIDRDTATNLYVGLSTDSGHFMHNTTTKELFCIAAKLIELGADPFGIANKLYKSRSINKTRLIVKAIQSLRFFRDNTICIMTVFMDDLSECGCVLSDTEGLIDYATSIAGVEVAACLAQQKDKLFKVGLRSKGANVSNIAAHFGGGGHTRAAGCVLNGYYEDIVDKLKRIIELELNLYDEQQG